MNQDSPLLVANGLTKRYSTPDGELLILDRVELNLSAGAALAVTGPSGAGKSTLLYVVGTLESPSSGTVQIMGQATQQLSAAELALFRNERIGFIFQDHHLLPQCTVLENVLIPTLARAASDADAHQRAEALLERVGLSQRQHHLPSRISGGERQRVAVCRALINGPSLLLADEPTGNLDRQTAQSVGDLLLEMSREHNAALICVTHSQELAERFSDHRELRDGRFEQPTLPAGSQ
jgi:lipoprotein-releasing system ATP-binding protein